MGKGKVTEHQFKASTGGLFYIGPCRQKVAPWALVLRLCRRRVERTVDWILVGNNAGSVLERDALETAKRRISATGHGVCGRH